ncbi:MAG: HD domain-containing protein [Myxococcales bacterium]|nr:HD domain-containing protein [Myxococcales bacterium]
MRNLLETLRRHNIEVFETGPNLRDELLGDDPRVSPQVELVTNAKLGQLEPLLRSLGIVLEMTDGRNGLQFAMPHEGRTFRVRVTAMRTMRGATAAYFRQRGLRPIEADLATREITINAIARDVDGELVDPFGGLEDLRAKRIRSVVPADQIVRANPLWLLKLPRYVSVLGYQPADELLREAYAVAGNVLDLQRERWRTEFERILVGPYVDQALQFMFDSRVLHHLLPEVSVLVGFEKSCAVHHKDIWEHTKQVVMRAKPIATVRWAALLHDVGKVFTRTVDDGKVHFFRHEEMSAILFEGIAARFEIPAPQAERIHYVVRNHSRINLYSEDWTDSAVRRLISHAGEHLEDLVFLSKADVTTQNSQRKEKIRALLQELELRIGEIREKDNYESPVPKKFGELIMEHFGLKPSKTVGHLRDMLEGALNDGLLEPGQPAAYYLRWLEAHASEITAQNE